MKVVYWRDGHGTPAFFRVTDDKEETEYSRFPSEAEANAFLQGFIAGAAMPLNEVEPALSDPAALSAAKPSRPSKALF